MPPQEELDADYFLDAMEYFREEYDSPAFLYVSDDMEWGRENIQVRASVWNTRVIAGGKNQATFVNFCVRYSIWEGNASRNALYEVSLYKDYVFVCDGKRSKYAFLESPI